MSFFNFLLILAGVMLNAFAQLFLKAGTNAINAMGIDKAKIVASAFKVVFEPHILGGLGCYAFSVIIWIVALSRVQVSVAYPMLSIGYVVNLFMAWYFFGEPISIQKMAGIVVIIIGVYLIAKS
ncbi:SMR family transporter [Burkholderia guangdongensis]|uniref:SMR family transporter n=1 Tax=Burkholderia guangdongensis TaxID=1792500 RepID=UPI0015CD5E30